MSILRGISQIFFIDNPVTGAVILIALACADPRLALLTALGSATQTVGAWALEVPGPGRPRFDGLQRCVSRGVDSPLCWVHTNLSGINGGGVTGLHHCAHCAAARE